MMMLGPEWHCLVALWGNQVFLGGLAMPRDCMIGKTYNFFLKSLALQAPLTVVTPAEKKHHKKIDNSRTSQLKLKRFMAWTCACQEAS